MCSSCHCSFLIQAHGAIKHIVKYIENVSFCQGIAFLYDNIPFVYIYHNISSITTIMASLMCVYT